MRSTVQLRGLTFFATALMIVCGVPSAWSSEPEFQTQADLLIRAFRTRNPEIIDRAIQSHPGFEETEAVMPAAIESESLHAVSHIIESRRSGTRSRRSPVREHDLHFAATCGSPEIFRFLLETAGKDALRVDALDHSVFGSIFGNSGFCRFREVSTETLSQKVEVFLGWAARNDQGWRLRFEDLSDLVEGGTPLNLAQQLFDRAERAKVRFSPSGRSFFHRKSLLYVAATTQHFELFEELLNRGVRPSMARTPEESLVHAILSATCGTNGEVGCRAVPLELVFRLQAQGVLQFTRSDALSIAQDGGRVEDLEAVIRTGVKLEGSGKDRLPSLLEVAIERNRLDIISWLIKAGVDLNRLDGFGRTPIALAAQQGQIQIVRILLARGVDLARSDGFFSKGARAEAREALIELKKRQDQLEAMHRSREASENLERIRVQERIVALLG